jgi:hypothetical protein
VIHIGVGYTAIGRRDVTPGHRLQSAVASPASLIIVAPSRASDPRVAGVVELVDAPDSKSGSERSVGSIPTARTTFSSQSTSGFAAAVMHFRIGARRPWKVSQAG